MSDLRHNSRLIISEFDGTLHNAHRLTAFVRCYHIGIIHVVSVRSHVSAFSRLFPSAGPSRIVHVFKSLSRRYTILHGTSTRVVRLRRGVQPPGGSRETLSGLRHRGGVIGVCGRKRDVSSVFTVDNFADQDSIFHVLGGRNIALGHKPRDKPLGGEGGRWAGGECGRWSVRRLL